MSGFPFLFFRWVRRPRDLFLRLDHWWAFNPQRPLFNKPAYAKGSSNHRSPLAARVQEFDERQPSPRPSLNVPMSPRATPSSYGLTPTSYIHKTPSSSIKPEHLACINRAQPLSTRGNHAPFPVTLISSFFLSCPLYNAAWRRDTVWQRDGAYLVWSRVITFVLSCKP
jgi:hypothetical protein